MEELSHSGKRIYTVGHSSHTVEEFVTLLRQHDIGLLVDVRSAPYSKFTPQFNRSKLEFALAGTQIRYRYSGRELGGKPEDETLQTPSGKHADYDKIAAQPEFQRELLAVVDMAADTNTALMCSEGDPMECHRERLLAPVLRSWGVEVIHILPDGGLRRQEQESLF